MTTVQLLAMHPASVLAFVIAGAILIGLGVMFRRL